MNRLFIYFHFDAQGIVDEPCRFAVQALRPFGKILFVTNGTLQPQSRCWVQDSGAMLLERENVGFDVGAYRAALKSLGKEAVQGFDELVLMNYTLAGPVIPLDTMFATMDARRDLDFWGLTRHYAMQSRRFGGRVPEHLQSHFLAVRSRLLHRDTFWRYWEKMPVPHSYEDSVIHHETKFTEYFSRQGFAWDSYLHTEDLQPVFVNPIMACPRELIQERGCPFFKRRSFFTPYADELRRTDGAAAVELEQYLERETNYPVQTLVSSLLRTQPLSALSQNLHWHYVVSADRKTAAADLAEEGLRVVSWSLPETDPVTMWYLQKSVQQAQKWLGQAVALFREHPLLGVLTPAVPVWPAAVQFHQRSWETYLQNQYSREVPVEQRCPPFSLAGWALLRQKAFSETECLSVSSEEGWALLLAAQKNGFYSATFETAEQAAARAEQLQLYMQASGQMGALLKQSARLVKHRLGYGQKGR